MDCYTGKSAIILLNAILEPQMKRKKKKKPRLSKLHQIPLSPERAPFVLLYKGRGE